MKTAQAIWHGDSIELCKRFQVKRNVQACIVDPPFGVDNQSNMATTVEGKAAARKIANDESPYQAMGVFSAIMGSLLPAMMDTSDIYVCTSWQVLEEWLSFTSALFEPHGYERKSIITWVKDGPGMGDTDNPWGMGCEFWLLYRRGRRPKSTTRRNSVVHVPQIRPDRLIHPHEKPEPLLQMFLKASVDPGGLAVDPCGGSGSLARAARNMAPPRSAVSIELDEGNYLEAKRAFDDQEESMFA